MTGRFKTRKNHCQRYEEIGVREIKEIKELCRLVSTSELFVGLPPGDIEEIACRANTLRFWPGDVIHSEDDPIKQVLLLLEGRIKRSQFSKSGQEVVLRLGVPGEIVDVPVLLPWSRHTSSVVALEACKVLAWEAETFNATVERLPGLLKNVQLILESRLAGLMQRFCEASTKRTSPRLAIGLLDLADRLGERVDDHIELRVSQETLGQMTGMTLNSVSRHISLWKTRGIVKQRRNILEIHSIPLLLRCADSVDDSVQGPELRNDVFVPATGSSESARRAT